MTKTKLIGFDFGEKQTGVVVITENGIREGQNIPNAEIVPMILREKSDCGKLFIVIEDIRPYNMRITDGIIETIKLIGEIQWRLFELGIAYTLIPRWQVKQWVFLQFRTMVEPMIVKKIEYARNRKEKLGQYINKKKQTPTFIYVDDRIIQQAMRKYWKIDKPKVGERAVLGLKDHSWQALGLASYYIVLHRPHDLVNLTTV